MQVRRMGTEPVFVDRTGRRRRLFVAAGAVGGLVLMLVSATLVAAFTGTGPVRLPLLPESTVGPARTAEPQAVPPAAPRPSNPAPPASGGGADAGAEPAPTTSPAAPAQGTGTTPSPTGKATKRRVPTHTPGSRPTTRP
nr:hypothetical protein [Micromonospora sp. DSM 115978]